MATILAIETSCDETALALVKDREILAQTVSSQVPIHAPYGGVVPEIASRQHLEWINWAIAEVLAEAGVSWGRIDAVAATSTPGLVGALLVGLTAAKTLALLHRKPLLGVHHLEGHIYAVYLREATLVPPFLCLLVSGGHTSLIQVQGCGQYQTLGQTRDDAAGEAFDKVARLLGLGYPGGPAIEQAAVGGNPHAFALPEGQVSQPDGGYHPYDTSFSGLKTAMLRLTQKLQQSGSELPVTDLAASFQATVVRALTRRAIACALDQELRTIVMGGGVAANSCLRESLQTAALLHGIKVIFPPPSLCTDNAAMIGCAAADHFNRGHRSSLWLGAQPRLDLTQVMELYQNSP